MTKSTQQMNQLVQKQGMTIYELNATCFTCDNLRTKLFGGWLGLALRVEVQTWDLSGQFDPFIWIYVSINSISYLALNLGGKKVASVFVLRYWTVAEREWWLVLCLETKVGMNFPVKEQQSLCGQVQWFWTLAVNDRWKDCGKLSM